MNSLLQTGFGMFPASVGRKRPGSGEKRFLIRTNSASPAVCSGVAVSGFDTDFYGNWRDPSTPCRGAIEFIRYDLAAGGSPGDVRDSGGRLIKRVIQGREETLDYDGRNRLTSWSWSSNAPSSGTYVYDHAGRRVLTRINAGSVTNTTRYVYDGTDVVTEFVDNDNDGAVDRTRTYWLLPGMDQRIGFADVTNSIVKFYYYITDQVGTVMQIVDEAGAVVNQYDYDAWGNVRWGSTNTFEKIENRYLFQGREYDRYGGFYYFRNRIYLPERGEFASPDMNLSRGILGEIDGMGTLAFCANNPVNFVDPYGLWAGWASGEPVSPGESLVPIWGSGRQAVNDFSTGHYVWGTVNTVVAVSDVFLVKAAVTGIAKGAVKLGGHSWSATRSWMAKTGRAEAGQEVHHWAIPQGGWGREVPNAIKNQPWNLMSMESLELHDALHGAGELGEFGRFMYGTPDWFKALLISEYGRIGNDFRGGGQDDCK